MSSPKCPNKNPIYESCQLHANYAVSSIHQMAQSDHRTKNAGASEWICCFQPSCMSLHLKDGANNANAAVAKGISIFWCWSHHGMLQLFVEPTSNLGIPVYNLPSQKAMKVVAESQRKKLYLLRRRRTSVPINV